jgi:purine-binding chemotaxis protein CheW
MEEGSLLFALDNPLYALPLPIVERVVRAVEIRPLPRAPQVVLGAINAHGRIIPVVDMRALFGLPPREMGLGDQFIIARTPKRVVAALVDRVIGITVFPEGKIISAESSLPFAERLRGVVRLDDDIVLIYDLDRFLSLDDELRLDAALAGGAT